MATNVEEINNAKSYSQATNTQADTARVKMWEQAINVARVRKGLDMLEFNVAETIDNMKTFSGAGASTGSGLVQTITGPLITGGLEGGAFIDSSVTYIPNVRGNYTPNSVLRSSGYVANAYSTPATNEISTFGNDPIVLTSYKALIQGSELVLATNPNPSQIILELENALEAEKLVLSDTLAASELVTSAIAGTSTAVNPTTLPTYGSIHTAMNRMIGQKSKYSIQGVRPKFYLRSEAFDALISEQDANGRFQDSQYQFKFTTEAQTVPAKGKVGTHGGFDVIIVASDSSNGILSTYTTNASGVITSASGSDKTAIWFGTPRGLHIIRGISEMDKITMYGGSAENSITEDINGRVSFVGTTSMGAGLLIPSFWAYYAFTL